jgi:hypothetical protein
MSRKPLVALLVVGATSLATTPAPAESTLSGSPMSPVTQAEVGVRRAIDRARTLLARPSLADKLTVVTGVPAEPLAAAVDEHPPAGLPAGLGIPIALLRAAALDAASHLPTSASDLRDLSGWSTAIASSTILRGGDGSTRVDFGSVRQARLPGRLQVRADAARREAQRLAAVLDVAVPALAAWSATHTTTGAATAPACDVYDERPIVCVSSEADTVGTRNAMIVVDLGGDDQHLGSSGGAPFAFEGQLIPVAVHVDLAGDDLYRSASSPAAPLAGPCGHAAQGAAALGVGIAVDLHGDDRYETFASPNSGGAATACTQGAGVAGAGALIDLEGSDSYRLSTTEAPYGSVLLMGQAVSNLGGAGLLVDQGEGDDSYTIAPPDRAGAATDLMGQGAGAYGDATLFDDGGSDAFALTSTSSYLIEGNFKRTKLSTVFGQGYGYLGTGWLLEGSGSTSYEASTTSRGSVAQILFAQGAGIFGPSTGVLDDRGGDDSYRAVTEGTWHRAPLIDDTCGCAAASEAMQAVYFAGTLIAQGSSASGPGEPSFGMLTDRSGNDSYLARNAHDLEVILTDALTSPATSAHVTVESANLQPQLLAQGAGNAQGNGALIDEDGSDRYDAAFVKDVAASATSTGTSEPPIVIARNRYRSGVAAQGSGWLAGSGLLRDEGGVGDRFTASAHMGATTTPDSDQAYVYADPFPAFQGGGEGLTYQPSSFAALGASPAIRSAPSQITCQGARGFGSWQECGRAALGASTEGVDQRGNAFGFAPFALGAAPSLTTVPDAPITFAGGARVASASARLLSPTGVPIQGALIHFDVQGTYPPVGDDDVLGAARSWDTWFESEGVTDADGVATARVLVGDVEAFLSHGPSHDVRVLATYGGGEGVYPAHAAAALRPAASG